MDRICHLHDIWKEEISRTEDPFFAQSIVRDLLQRNTQLRRRTVRRTTQYFVEASDEWAIGQSWHWRPVVANEVYEFREGAY